MTKYKLNFKRDVDTDEPGVLILNLPAGFRFYDDEVHVRGYESMAELKDAVKYDIIPCDCKQCQKELAAK
jgi:hypothetical protein